MWNIDSLSGQKTEVCEEMRKMVYVCCLLVRWRKQGSMLVGIEGRIFMLWSSENEHGGEGLGVTLKEELCEKIAEV